MKKEEDFSDIINLEWPNNTFHQKMNLTNRAKIFLPFAALKGFEDEIETKKMDLEKEFSIVHTNNLEE